MSKYKIYIYTTVSAVREVEASNYEEAVEQALESPPYAPGFAEYEFSDEWDASPEHEVDGEYVEEVNYEPESL